MRRRGRGRKRWVGRRRRSRWPLGSGQLARAGGHAKDFLKIFARAVVGCLGWVGGCGDGAQCGR